MGDSESIGVRRIVVRNLSRQVTVDDVKSLFEKVHVKVQDVYLPPLLVDIGVRRDFAIVRIECEQKSAYKCIKTFNGSLWKGSRISVEMAQQPYFRERLEMEWKQEAEEQDEGELRNVHEMEEHFIPYTAQPIKLRKRKLVQQRGSRKNTTKQNFCGKVSLCKVKFNVQSEPTLAFDLFDGTDGLNDELKIAIAETTAARKVRLGDAAPCGIKTIFDQTLVPVAIERQQQHRLLFSQSDLNVVDALKDESDEVEKEVKEEFHTAPLQAPETKNLFASSNNDTSERPSGGGIRRGFGTLVNVSKSKQLCCTDPSLSAVDCCVESADPFAQEDEALLRKLNLLVPEEDRDSMEPCVRAEELEEEALINERKRALELLEGVLSTDRTNMSQPFQTTGASENEPNNLAGIELNEPVQIAGQIGGATTEVTHVEEVHAQPFMDTNSGFADVGQLKNIFHREGGVWWGDEGTDRQQARGKGDVATDAIFRAAEKFGIDIRGHGGGSGDIHTTVGPGAAAASTFSFNFGAETTTDENAVDQRIITVPAEVSQSHLFNSFNESKHSITSTVQPSADARKAKTKLNVKETFSVADIVTTAKVFSRDRSIAELTESWKIGRERMVHDYKKKRKDMLRKQNAGTVVDRSNRGRNGN